ncbi:ferritin-like domain-containing protein [Flavobacterium psychrotrophum]|uniref:ferritin-like domain-containing protein n=1 Tax=Flavobacterium psychrotrophum TaxID=2294119 RepID=UPI000E317480|nr:ferritin-like domain-containing protein [Flavobacterium psychrotrophum]
MNIIKFIESFTNEGIIQSLHTKGSRRDSLNQFGKAGATAALAAVPFISMFSQKANAASSAYTAAADNSATAALQLALTLEYLEDEFYAMALDKSGLIPTTDRTIFAQISQHEAAHVEFLKKALGNNAPDKPTFDFTGRKGGTGTLVFDPFNDYQQFLALSQAFEDTGVRAYKGQAVNLMGDKATLTAALQIHSVEARHASVVRRLRGNRGWIPGVDGMHPAAADAVYAGEGNTTHATINVATFTPTQGNPAFGDAADSASFDEPLDATASTNIAKLFFAQ